MCNLWCKIEYCMSHIFTHIDSVSMMSFWILPWQWHCARNSRKHIVAQNTLFSDRKLADCYCSWCNFLWTKDLSRDGKNWFSLSPISVSAFSSVFFEDFCFFSRCSTMRFQFVGKLTKVMNSTYVYRTASSSHNPSENLNFDERLCLENEISVR